MRTSLYSILCIVVRLGAMLLFVQTVTSLPTMLPTMQAWSGDPNEEAARGMLIGFGGALIALSVALWLYPGMIARLATTSASHQPFESSIDAKELQYIALSVLGVAFAMGALLDLVSFAFRLALSARFGDTAFTMLLWQSGSSLLVCVLKLVIGLGLAFGAHGLTGLLHRLRERGLPPAWPESSTNELSLPKP